ncbi:unnamed protein product [Lymnaea stagnalis]|uniref:Large ribosomal subunit protein mL38 n=1 Tax=Lymnaea stagnalis TaxID=6523 RepID=A0AAV2HIM9_LYMST
MAACMTFKSKIFNGSLAKASKTFLVQPVRNRWKPPDRDLEILPSFAERLAAWKAKYQLPASHGINIGLKYDGVNQNHNNIERIKKWMEKRKPLETLAHNRQLNVDMERVKEDWHNESMPQHVRKISEHYGIFKDLFDGAHFFPVIPLDVAYDYDEELVTPVRYGNIIPACETSAKPSVSFKVADDSLWTLVMSSPDGNLEDSSKEILHWFVGNIPGNDLNKGELICNYLQPFPPKGVGFLRYVFVLYKQDRIVDFSSIKKPENCLSLRDRSFSSLDFYRKHQADLTPAGVSFFQSEWDKSITSFFHHVLDMKEPAFEFIHPPAYHPEQLDYPHRLPFNVYLDNYRHVKDIQEEVLKRKLKKVDPMRPPQPRPKYPNLDKPPEYLPSWLEVREQEVRLGNAQWSDLYKDKD